MSNPETKPVLAFDVDGTVFKSALIEKIIQSSIEHKLFKAAAFNAVYEKRQRWQADNNEAVYQAYLKHLVTTFVIEITGIEVERFQKVAATMVAEQQVRRFKFPQLLIAAKRNSHFLLAISGSPTLLVEPFLEDLAPDAIYGSTYIHKDGVFTGEAYSVGDKGHIVQKLAAEGAILLNHESIAVGDTMSDAPLLETVGQPIAFNASRTLTNLAKQARWARINEIKDQITALDYNKEAGVYHETDVEAII